jgi:hypothetical protein
MNEERNSIFKRLTKSVNSQAVGGVFTCTIAVPVAIFLKSNAQWKERIMRDMLDGLIFRLFGEMIARRFVVFGGVPAALLRGSRLRAEGITPTYNRIDEHVYSLKRVDEIVASYIDIVLRMDYRNRGHIAIKPSAFGITFGSFVFARKLRRLIDAIAGKVIEIEIDAEDRKTLVDVQEALNLLAPKLPKGITFRPAFQMHLPTEFREELIKKCHILEMPVRIVKGSGLYNVGSKETNDEGVLIRYKETFRRQLRSGKHPNVATVRDQKLIESLLEVAFAERADRSEFTIQFLDGPFGRSLARKYVAERFRVGCYVTFVEPSAPDEWKEYVQRRIAFGRKLIFDL